MEYFLILDVGTTNVKACAFSGGKLLESAEEKLTPLHPQPGWAELDPMQVVRAVYRVSDAIVSKLGTPKALGITNQRSSTAVWYRETGEPLCNIITWQDTRTIQLVREYSRKGLVALGRCVGRAAEALSTIVRPLKFTRRGAYLITLAHASFGTTHSSMHLRWIMDNVEGARSALERGAAVFGTMDSWVAWNLTGEHVTDYTNASATGLFDPYAMRWSATLLKLLEIPQQCLPRIVTNDTPIGRVSHLNAPLLTIIADQQASLYVAGVRKGAAKITCGTGAFIDVNVGARPPPAARGIYPMVALTTRKNALYLLEGFVTTAGSAIEWLLRIGVLKDYSELDEAATKGRSGVIFVPALEGLGTPFMKPDARAVLANLSSDTTREDLIRGVLEGIAACCSLAMSHLQRASHVEIPEVFADGGLTQSNVFLQLLADFSARKIVRTHYSNNSAYGAYMLCERIIRGEDPIEHWTPPGISRIFEPRGGGVLPARLTSLLKRTMS
ncbi:MAG: FGGY family carbohydrate kinase [Thermofilaceae archaeon]